MPTIIAPLARGSRLGCPMIVDHSLTCCLGPCYELPLVEAGSGIVLGYALLLLASLGAAARRQALPWVAARLAARRLRRLPLTIAEQVREGATVRLVGTVSEGTSFPAPLTGVPCVAARHTVRARSGALVAESITGEAFAIDVPGLGLVQVAIGEAGREQRLTIVDRQPQNWRASPGQHLAAQLADGWFSESRVCLGDRVEVVGVVSRRPHPTARHGGYREPPMAWTVAPGQAFLTVCFATRRPQRTLGRVEAS